MTSEPFVKEPPLGYSQLDIKETVEFGDLYWASYASEEWLPVDKKSLLIGSLIARSPRFRFARKIENRTEF